MSFLLDPEQVLSSSSSNLGINDFDAQTKALESEF